MGDDEPEPYLYWYAPENSFGISEMKEVNWSYWVPWLKDMFDWGLQASGGITETTVCYDTFGSSSSSFQWGNYTDGGTNCIAYTGSTYAHNPPNAVDIQSYGSSSLFTLTNPVLCTTNGYTDVSVDFWFYPVSMEAGEDFWLQYNNGSGWVTVKSYVSGTDFSNNVFYHDIVHINSSGGFNLTDNAKVRFVCDASATNDDVYIDQIFVNATNDMVWYDANQLLKVGLDLNETNQSAKVTLTLNTTGAPKDLYYRFYLICNNTLRDYLEMDGYEWSLTLPANSTENYTVLFNWSDIKDLIANGKVVFDRGVKNDKFWFTITTVNKIPVGIVFVVDPTFGNSSPGSSTSTLSNYISGIHTTSSAETGKADNITTYVKISSGSQCDIKYKGALYDSSDNLIASTDESVYFTTATAQWITLNFSGTKPDIIGSTNYNLYVWAQKNGSNYAGMYRTSSGTRYFKEVTYDGNFPSSLTGMSSSSSASLVVYCSYTEGGGEETRESTQVFNYWFNCSNGTRSIVQVFNNWFLCGNATARASTQVFNYWFLCGNTTTRTGTQVFNYWFLCGNTTARAGTQVLNNWFLCGNLTSRSPAQVFNYWFLCGNGTTRSVTQVLDNWFLCGNVSANRVSTQAFNYWFQCGNGTRGIVQVLNNWFLCGNGTIRTGTLVFNNWFLCGNESIPDIIISNVYPGNNSFSIPLQPTLYLTVNSTVGNTLNLSFYYGPSLDSTPYLLGSYNSQPNGTYSMLDYNASSKVTDYYWRIQVDDGMNWINYSYDFTTEGLVNSFPPSNGIALLGIFSILGVIAFIRMRRRRK